MRIASPVLDFQKNTRKPARTVKNRTSPEILCDLQINATSKYICNVQIYYHTINE